LTGLGGGQTVGYTEVGGLTPLRGSQTTKVAEAGSLTTHCGGWTTRGGLSALSIFSRNKILSIFFVASVVTQNTLSFSRIMRALSNSREGDYSQYFQGDEYSQYLIVVQ
jgi:hypothetical protein